MEENQVASGDKQQVSDSVDNNQTQDKTVSYESHRKLLGEKKAAQDRLRELEAFKASVEEAKAIEEGNHTKVIESLREQLAKEKEEKGKITKTVAYEKFSSQVGKVAKELGCVDEATLMMFMDKERQASIQLDDKLNANKDDLLRVVNEIKEQKPFLFGSQTVNHTPVTMGGFKKPVEKTIADMSKEEIKAMARKLL